MAHKLSNIAASTNARVMTPFGQSKSTLNYAYCVFYNWSIDPHQHEQETNQLYILLSTQKCSNDPHGWEQNCLQPLYHSSPYSSHRKKLCGPDSLAKSVNGSLSPKSIIYYCLAIYHQRWVGREKSK